MDILSVYCQQAACCIKHTYTAIFLQQVVHILCELHWVLKETLRLIDGVVSFADQMLFLMPVQQCQSLKGNRSDRNKTHTECG